MPGNIFTGNRPASSKVRSCFNNLYVENSSNISVIHYFFFITLKKLWRLFQIALWIPIHCYNLRFQWDQFTSLGSNRNSCCNGQLPSYSPLKEMVFDGRIKETTPLLLACQYGEFKSVKQIVEFWGVDDRNLFPASNFFTSRTRDEN